MTVKSTEFVGPGLKPDPRYGNRLASKFINCLMLDGKKTKAEMIFYNALDLIAERLKNEDPIQVFEKAIYNVRPSVEVKSRRVGGANYQVPIKVEPDRATSLAFRWLLASARGQKGKPMHERLAAELMDAFNGTGKAMHQREQTHRMAEANKAFAHFAW
jgi:small subunit ribosomal protein S7